MRTILWWNTAIVLAHVVVRTLTPEGPHLEQAIIIISLVAAIIAAGFGTSAAFGVAVASTHPVFQRDVLFAIAMNGTFSQIVVALMQFFLLLVASILFTAREARKAGAKEPKWALMIAAFPDGFGLILGWPLYLLFIFFQRRSLKVN